MSLRVSGDRPIKTLPGLATRPTPSRVRAAVCNIWQNRIAGSRWLDLCTGSGAMAAEALIHGAISVVGIEQSGRACRLIEQNLQAIATSEQSWRIYRGDVLKILPKLPPQQFDLVYFDPPYQSNLYEPVLTALAELDSLLAPQAIVAVEHDRARPLPQAIVNLITVDYRRYGQTALTFFSVVS